MNGAELHRCSAVAEDTSPCAVGQTPAPDGGAGNGIVHKTMKNEWFMYHRA
jgi:hypothetical protein